VVFNVPHVMNDRAPPVYMSDIVINLQLTQLAQEYIAVGMLMTLRKSHIHFRPCVGERHILRTSSRGRHGTDSCWLYCGCTHRHIILLMDGPCNLFVVIECKSRRSGISRPCHNFDQETAWRRNDLQLWFPTNTYLIEAKQMSFSYYLM
jgi:hypothetical protein